MRKLLVALGFALVLLVHQRAQAQCTGTICADDLHTGSTLSTEPSADDEYVKSQYGTHLDGRTKVTPARHVKKAVHSTHTGKRRHHARSDH